MPLWSNLNWIPIGPALMFFLIKPPATFLKGDVNVTFSLTGIQVTASNTADSLVLMTACFFWLSFFLTCHVINMILYDEITLVSKFTFVFCHCYCKFGTPFIPCCIVRFWWHCQASCQPASSLQAVGASYCSGEEGGDTGAVRHVHMLFIACR